MTQQVSLSDLHASPVETRYGSPLKNTITTINVEANSVTFLSQFARHSRLATVALAGGLLASALAAGPASAATITQQACANNSGWSIVAEAVTPTQLPSGRIVLQATPPDGVYVGSAQVHVFCQDTMGNNLGDITGAMVQISIDTSGTTTPNSMFTITGPGVTTPGNPVVIGPFDGFGSFTVRGASNLLPPGVASAQVGVNYDVVTQAWGTPLGGPLSAGGSADGTVFARTPELDSIALFATGALGLLSYAALRRRARAAHKD